VSSVKVGGIEGIITFCRTHKIPNPMQHSTSYGLWLMVQLVDKGLNSQEGHAPSLCNYIYTF